MSITQKSPSHISHIKFSILGNEDVQKFSVIKDETSVDNLGVVYPDAYDNNEPKIRGLIDKRMGITDQHYVCSHCGLDTHKCEGHFGHRELAEPMYHIGFMTYLKRVLQCIDLKVIRLLIKPDDPKLQQLLHIKDNKKRFSQIYDLITSNVKRSPYTNLKVPKVTREISRKGGSTIQIIVDHPYDESLVGNGFEVVTKGKVKFVRQILSQLDCLNILSNLSQEEKNILGVTNPESMILTTFPVPPVAIRPSIRGGPRHTFTTEDMLTQKLADIVKHDNKFRELKAKEFMNNSDDNITSHSRQLVQYHIATYYDNESAMLLPSTSSSNIPCKSITSRYKGGKEARIRGNLMGKRVNYSARTVITSDPSMGTDELGVPITIAMTLTYPEIVTPYNIKELTKLVRNGPKRYPGANYVEHDNERMNDLNLRNNIDLEYGWIVHRHLQDDDVVLLNRQPSLHKLSTMSHRIKVINDPNLLTFRLNVTATEPYNADFDGDEMNIMAPQSQEAKIELQMLADIKKNNISPSTSAPIVSLKQDAVIGAYLFTQPDTMIDWKKVQVLLTYTTAGSELVKGNLKLEKRKYSGREVFSMLIGEKVNINWDNASGKMKIVNGEIKEGCLTKSEIGGKKNNILHQLSDSYGSTASKDFMDGIQRMMSSWLMKYSGFTVGLGDCFCSDDMRLHIYQKISEKCTSVMNLITETENDPNLLSHDTFETIVYAELNSVLGNMANAIIKDTDNKNNFFAMLTSGSKGKPENLGQIMACLGQQTYQGRSERFPLDLNGRSAPSFCKGDTSPSARGFIQRSYLQGLSPHEFYIHNGSGRTGLIDTAIKTADTGYMQRRLMKMLEDGLITYSATVVNSLNGIIQYVYGETGYDVARQMEVKVNLIGMGDDDLDEHFKLSSDQMKTAGVTKSVLDKYMSMVKATRQELRDSQFKATLRHDISNKKFNLPFNIQRILNYLANKTFKTQTKISFKDCVNAMDTVLMPDKTCVTTYSETQLSKPGKMKQMDTNTTKSLLRIALVEYMAPKQLLFKYGFTKEHLDELVEELTVTHNSNIVNPGEMVGALAAQSICEPLTQMTLNTFHASGLGSTVAGMTGIPRVKELIGFTENIKRPTMRLFLKDDISTNTEEANILASELANITLDQISSSTEIVYDKNPDSPSSFHSKDRIIGKYVRYIQKGKPTLSSMPWVIRIVLDDNAMYSSHLNLTLIKDILAQSWDNLLKGIRQRAKDKELFNDIGEHICFGSTSEDSEQLIVHIRFSPNKYNYNYMIQLMELLTTNLKIRGMSGIDTAEVIEIKNLMTDEKTGKQSDKNECVINTTGCNLIDIQNYRKIDALRCITDDMYAIYQHYGIEAARVALINEFNYVFENAGKSLNYQHLSMLIDSMTSQGTVTPVNRYGLNKLQTDPLTRASFEKTIEMLIEAAVFGEIDSLTSVSSRIMTGKSINGGTGYMDVLMDTEMLETTEYNAMERNAFNSHNQLNLFESNPMIDDMFESVQAH